MTLYRRNLLGWGGLGGMMSLSGCLEGDDSSGGDGDAGSDEHGTDVDGSDGNATGNADADASPTREGGGPPDPDGWSVAFEDAFDEGSLDEEKWSIGYGWGRETDWTDERIEDSHVRVDDEADHLVLEVSNPDEYDGFYSGAVNTQDRHAQQHGYWEARVKVPSEPRGLLPAFWAKPNDESWPPEIDVLEFFADTTTSHHTIHYEDCEGEKGERGFENALEADAAEEFHVFGAEWNAEEVVWYVDGAEVARTSEANGTDCKFLNNGKEFYTMLNVHVAEYDFLGGDPAENDDYPYEYRIDWVRIWEQA